MEVKPTEIASVTGGVTMPDGLGKDTFLKLFLAQLQQQDPLNPLEDKDFIVQLAQFTHLEEVMETNERLGLLEAAQGAVVNGQTAGLIGRSVVASGNSLTIGQDGAPDLSFYLHGQASDVDVRILDAGGNVVRTLRLGSFGEGEHTVAWDGLNDSGVPVPPGEYSVEVSALAGEENVESEARTVGVVTGVSFKNGYAELMIGEQRVNPGDVIDVLDSDSATGGAP